MSTPQSNGDASSVRAHLIAATLAAHFHRRAQGDGPSDDSLIAAHPELAPDLAAALRMGPLLMGLGSGSEDSAGAQTVAFGVTHSDTRPGCLAVRCPTCQISVEVAADTQLTDLVCSSCGSHFSLVDKQHATQMAPTLTKMGRFDLIERLGVGGFGTVWKARDKDLDRTVALKVPRQAGQTPEEIEKFFREARAAAQLRHPNIVSVHEVGRDGDTVFIVSDFVRGVTLGDWLTGQKLTSRESAELCSIIGSALHHAHEKGVVHRDLKPANIMIDGDGQPHIMDFGLALRDAGEVTVTMDGQVLGTPAYMSPEQAAGEAHKADRRSDVYSLGVVLFQLLTGELPFRGNPRMLIHQVINDDPPSPRKLNSSVPRDLETITLKCLEKSPAKRYAAADEVAADLRRWMTHQPIAARPTSWPERGWRWVRRNAAVAGLAFVIFLGLLTFTGLSLRSASAIRSENQRTQAALVEVEQARRAAEAAAVRNRQLAYSTTMNVAAQAWETGGIRRLLAALAEQCPQAGEPNLRDFQWRQLWRSAAPYASSTILRSEAPIHSVAYSSDGRWLACGASDGSVIIWRPETGEFVRRIKTGAKVVASVAFVPKSSVVAVLTSDGALGNGVLPDNGIVRLWDVDSGELTASTADTAKNLTALATAPTGDQFVTGDAEGQLKMWDLRGRLASVQFEPYESPVVAIAWANEGSVIAASYADMKAIVWNAKTGKRLLDDAIQIGPDNYGGLALSPDGTFLAVGAYQRVHLLNISTETLLRTAFCHANNSVNSIAWSPNGKTFATTGGDGAVILHSIDDDNQLRVLKGHVGNIFSASYSPDGLCLATGGEDGSTVLWDVPDLNERDEWTVHKQPVTALAFSPRTSLTISGSYNGELSVWDARDCSLQQRLDAKSDGSALTKIAFFSSGERFATMSGDGALRVWDAESMKQIQEIRQDAAAKLPAMDVDPQGRLAAIQTANNEITLCRLDTGKTGHVLQGHSDEINHLDFAPTGKTLLSVGSVQPAGGEAFLWDVETGKRIASHVEPRAAIVSAAVGPQGDVIVLGLAQTNGIAEILVCGAKDLKVRSRLVADGQVNALCFSPDGSAFVSACGDGTIRHWTVANYADEGALAKVTAMPITVSFDPAGDLVAVGLANGKVRLIRAVHLGDAAAARTTLARLPRPLEQWPLDSGSAETIEFYKSLVAENREKLGADHPTTLQAALQLKFLYAKRGLPGWEEGYLDAVDQLQRVLGARHRDVLRAKFNLGQIYAERDRPVVAAPYFELCLPLQLSELGVSHRETIATLEALADAYGKIGRRDDQLALQEQLLVAKQTLLGDAHIESMLAEKALIDALVAAKKLDRAAPHWRHRIEILRRELGDDHNDVVVAMREFGALQLKAGENDEAIKLLSDVVKHWPDDWYARATLCEAYAAANQVPSAKHSLDDLLATVDDKDLDAKRLDQLGAMCYWSDEADKAIDYLTRATADPQAVPDQTWERLAQAYVKANRPDDAIDAWGKAVEQTSSRLGATSEPVNELRRKLVTALFHAGRDDDAIAALPGVGGDPWASRWTYYDAIEAADAEGRSEAADKLLETFIRWVNLSLAANPNQQAALLAVSAERLNERESWEPSARLARASVDAAVAVFGEEHPVTHRAQTVLSASTERRRAETPLAGPASDTQPPIVDLFDSVGQVRTVAFRVRLVGGNNNMFLNSQDEFTRKDCFTVKINEAAVKGFVALGIKDPWHELPGRLVEVTGAIVETEGQLSIVVDDVARQLRVKDEAR